MIEELVRYVGLVLVVAGCLVNLIGAIGLNRFKNFYLRLHAATVSTIGGTFYPLVGLALISLTMSELGELRFFMGGSLVVAAFILLMLAPAGSHALARATHRAKISKPEPVIADHLAEDRGG
ncbi:MAG: monovalent cation/H(+) antiporter subunit G [Sulfolobales archaeon]|nr:monovalent cation/H(+) antiporter subunit G [Sulfolobales archaeon]MDW8083342.1 monovalent cation/H(+) antiporter subunit G [Sulfolobales archaeon]